MDTKALPPHLRHLKNTPPHLRNLSPNKGLPPHLRHPSLAARNSQASNKQQTSPTPVAAQPVLAHPTEKRENAKGQDSVLVHSTEHRKDAKGQGPPKEAETLSADAENGIANPATPFPEQMSLADDLTKKSAVDNPTGTPSGNPNASEGYATIEMASHGNVTQTDSSHINSGDDDAKTQTDPAPQNSTPKTPELWASRCTPIRTSPLGQSLGQGLWKANTRMPRHGHSWLTQHSNTPTTVDTAVKRNTSAEMNTPTQVAHHSSPKATHATSAESDLKKNVTTPDAQTGTYSAATINPFTPVSSHVKLPASNGGRQAVHHGGNSRCESRSTHVRGQSPSQLAEARAASTSHDKKQPGTVSFKADNLASDHRQVHSDKPQEHSDPRLGSNDRSLSPISQLAREDDPFAAIDDDNGWDDGEGRELGRIEAVVNPLTSEALAQATGAAPEPKTRSVGSVSRFAAPGLEPATFPELDVQATGQMTSEPDYRGQDPVSQTIKWEEDEGMDREPMDRLQKVSWGEDTSPAAQFIYRWLTKAHQVRARFPGPRTTVYEDCDIDTQTGEILRPVIQPRTRRQGPMGLDQLNLSSQHRIEEFAAFARQVKERRRFLKRASATRDVTPTTEVRAPSPAPPCPWEVQIPCHLRPAAKADVRAVAEIYNHEVENGYRLVDAEPVPDERFLEILGFCRQAHMPFLVAVDGWYRHGDAIPGRKVIGFAMVDVGHRGIGGSRATHGTATGKLTAIVHPDFRHKKIGTALFDVVMSTCSPKYNTKQGYQFINLSNDPTYRRPPFNSRSWHSLELDVNIRSEKTLRETKAAAEFNWIWNWLEERFILLLVHHNERALYDNRDNRGVFLDKLTFRHMCRPVAVNTL
ncbi:hypothetical protein F4780DRAFT_631356 [Xylariomycetidae sp. FL0641]|nr:hypothetical protein F4780DRAFT_631356 [Xylariomycetidae sp. FL0641]